MVNIDVLRDAVEWVEWQDSLPPEKRNWYQGDWVAPPESYADHLAGNGIKVDPAACGTAYCVAGYIGQKHDKRYAKNFVVDGEHVADFAVRVLGVENVWLNDGSDLFDGSNSAKDIRRIAEEIAGQPL